MIFYRYRFDGEALGGEMIVIAHSRKDADKLAEEQLRSSYKRLKDPIKSLNLEFENSWEHDRLLGSVVYYCNGDY